MIVDKEKVDTGEFIREFCKRFTNFCQKAPVEISFKTTPTSVYIHEHKSNEVKQFNFDYGKDVKANIKDIKDWLVENKYPVMIQLVVQSRPYSTDEIREMINSGVPEDEALMADKEESYHVRWRIERVIVRRDELFLRNIENDAVYHYKIKMPCILFLKRFREKLNPFEAYELFEDRAVLLQEVEELHK